MKPDLHEIIAEAVTRGSLIMNVSQCKKGEVSLEYEGALDLNKLGVIPGYDMTMECTLAKLSYILGKKYPLEVAKKMMVRNLRGEITNTDNYLSLTVNNPSFMVELSSLAHQFFPGALPNKRLLPSLLSEAAALGQKEAFIKLVTLGYSVNQRDYEGRTPLHIAAIFGKIETGRELINLGIDANVNDNVGNTALYYAIKHKNYDMARMLHAHKAVLHAHKDDLDKMILNAGYVGKLQRLKSIHECGADIGIVDEKNRRSVAHLAAINKHHKLLEYLAGIYPALLEQKDAYSKLPKDYLH